MSNDKMQMVVTHEERATLLINGFLADFFCVNGRWRVYLYQQRTDAAGVPFFTDARATGWLDTEANARNAASRLAKRQKRTAGPSPAAGRS